MIVQWLGPNARLTLWRVTSDPFTSTLLGHIQDDGDTWSAWLRVDGEAVKLPGEGDRETAGRTLCARVRVGMVELPEITEEDEP